MLSNEMFVTVTQITRPYIQTQTMYAKFKEFIEPLIKIPSLTTEFPADTDG